MMWYTCTSIDIVDRGGPIGEKRRIFANGSSSAHCRASALEDCGVADNLLHISARKVRCEVNF